MATSELQALQELCARIERLHKDGYHVLRGNEAEATRSAYYRYWLEAGKPDSRLHARIARSVYANNGINLALLRPALAELVAEIN